MKPNRLGGQTLYGREVAVALSSAETYDLALVTKLRSQVSRSHFTSTEEFLNEYFAAELALQEKLQSNGDPDAHIGRNVLHNMGNHALEAHPDLSLESLELGPEETASVLGFVAKAVKEKRYAPPIERMLADAA